MTSKFFIVGYLVLLFFDTLAQVAFKLGAVNCSPVQLSPDWWLKVAHEPWVYIAVFCFLGAFATYTSILKHAPVGPVFAASHLDVVAVILVSVMFLNEHMTPVQILGSLLIIGGVALLGIDGSKRSPDHSLDHLQGHSTGSLK